MEIKGKIVDKRKFKDIIVNKWKAVNEILFVLLGMMSYTDWKERRIPLWMVGLGVLMWMIQIVYQMIKGSFLWRQIIANIFGSFALCGLCFCYRMWKKEGIGLGDIWVIGLIGLLAGWEWMIGITLIALFLAGLVSIMMLGRGKSKKETLPFVPFLLVGFCCTKMIEMY